MNEPYKMCESEAKTLFEKLDVVTHIAHWNIKEPSGRGREEITRARTTLNDAVVKIIKTTEWEDDGKRNRYELHVKGKEVSAEYFDYSYCTHSSKFAGFSSSHVVENFLENLLRKYKDSKQTENINQRKDVNENSERFNRWLYQ